MSDEGYEMEYVKEAFDTNWIAPLGENVNEFEKELAAKVGSKGGAALSSGTAAIHLALRAAGVEEGDTVFCPTLTFSATANPIIYQNAIPVFIDSNYETWNMCPSALEEAFKKYPEVKAVIVVHLYGLSADLDRIVELCNKYKVALIEDAAESLGTYYKGRHTGPLETTASSLLMETKSSPPQVAECSFQITRKELLKQDFGQPNQGIQLGTISIVN